MRHKKQGRKLNRTASHRKAMLSNMAANLFIHKQIRTTHPKALETRRFVEALITKAKKGDLHSRREVLKVIPQKDVVKILFEEIAPQYADRQGGYTRILKTGFRLGDNAQMCFIELVDYNENMLTDGSTKKSTSRRRRGGAKKAASTEAKAETKQEVKDEVATEEPAKEEKAAKTETPKADESKAEAKSAEDTQADDNNADEEKKEQ